MITRPGSGDENEGGGEEGGKITETERFGQGQSARPCCIYFDNSKCCNT